MVMNFLHRSCIILSFFWTALSFSQSPSVYFNRLTMENGLSHNCVNKAIEDKNGFIWFGTDNGLCRYDGYQVQNFYNLQMKFDQYVSALEACDEGLLVGTSKGAFLLTLKPNSFRN